MEDAPAPAPEAEAGECDYTPAPGTMVEAWVPGDLPDFPGKPQVLALGEALAALYTTVTSLSSDAPAEGLRVAEWAQRKIATAVTQVGAVAQRIQTIEEALGEHHLRPGVLSRRLRDLKNRLDSLPETIPSSEDFNDLLADRDRLDAIESDFGGMLEETEAALTDYISDVSVRVNVLEKASPSRGGPPPMVAPALGMEAMITGPGGDDICTLGTLVTDLQECQGRLLAAEGKISKMEADVVAQGGVLFNNRTYTSESAIKAMVLAEDARGDSFACFSSFPLIWPHDAGYTPTADWLSRSKQWRKGEDSLSEAEARYAVALTQHYPSHYAGTDASAVAAGKVLRAFETRSKWEGKEGMRGQKDYIEESLESAMEALSTHIDSHLPADGELHKLATAMATATGRWIPALHNFFGSDIKMLVETGLSTTQVLTLVSEYLIIICDAIWSQLQKALPYRPGANRADFTTRVIWVNLLIHKEMAAFADGRKMRYNPRLGIAYNRFLTREFGALDVTKTKNTVKDLASKVEGVTAVAEKFKHISKEDFVTQKATAVEAKRKAADAEKKVTDLAKRVGKLESK